MASLSVFAVAISTALLLLTLGVNQGYEEFKRIERRRKLAVGLKSG